MGYSVYTMPKDKIIKLRIEGIAAGGAGRARSGGMAVFVHGCAPDELVICRITEEHKSWARAELLEIVEASEARTEPACAYYGICGGCNLQHIDYMTQLEVKVSILTESFVRIGGFAPPQPQVVPCREWEYRNRFQFHCVKGDRASIGLMGRKSGEVITVRDCLIADPGIRGVLRSSARSVRENLSPEKDRFTVYSRNGFILSEGGVRRGRTGLLDREIVVDASVFFQSNASMLERVIADLLEFAGGADRSLAMADLYCGVGTFAAFLGPLFAGADLVEDNTTALAVARENVKGTDNGFFACKDRDWVKQKMKAKSAASPAHRGAYGFIVADPPRQGLAVELASWLAAQRAPLAYVSCDPASLCRDSKILVSGGYKLSSLDLYDFYPQTSHIESMALFVK